jgi:hypothetical protein
VDPGLQSQVDADIANCSNLASQADRCCNNPSSCISNLPADQQQSLARLQQMARGPAAGQGISDFCQQAKQMQAESGNVNMGLGQLCTVPQVSCSQTCSGMVNRYQGMLNGCSGASCQIYQNALNSLSAKASACDGLRGLADQITARGVSSGTDQGIAAYCQNNAGGSGDSTGLGSVGKMALSAANTMLNAKGNAIPDFNGPAPNAADPFGCQSQPGSASCQQCSQNPGLPACQALAKANAPTTIQAGFSQNSKSAQNDPNFNLGSVPDQMTGGQTAFGDFKPTPEGAVKPVPNNSGGGIPGSNDGSGSAQMDPPPRYASGTPHTSTDILQGYRSGGGYSPPVGSANSNGNSTTSYAAYGGAYRGPANTGKAFHPIDLKEYLPGGRLDPKRGPAGYEGARDVIMGRGVDLFEVIHNKYVELCKLGRLYDCQM